MRKNGIRSFEHIMDLSEALGPSFLSKEKGVIENVVILTGEKVSRNKTFYTQKALSEAVKRYEGAKMFIDHPEKGKEGARSVRDLGGTYRNIRIEENKFLKADLHLLPNDNVRNLVFPLAEAKLPGVGLSIRDRGRGREEDGIFLVEGFSKTNGYSIDLVTEASVNENLFESDEGGDDMKLSEATLEDLQAENAALVEKIRGDERQAVLKELEEKIKGGEDATKILSQGKKLILLAEAGLPGDIVDKVKKIIEPESVSLEVAESIITQQKEIVESLKASTKPNDPKVKGHGDSKDKDTQEGDVPNAEELAESLMNL